MYSPPPLLPLHHPTLPLLSEAHMLFPEYFQELLGWCPSRGLGLLPPPPHPSQPPSRSAGRESVPALTKHLAEGKKRSAVDDFSSVSRGPGLRRPEPRLLAVTRGFAPPRFCLSPLCPAEDWLQRIVLVCCGRLFSETRSTLWTHRRSISPVQTNPRRQA